MKPLRRELGRDANSASIDIASDVLQVLVRGRDARDLLGERCDLWTRMEELVLVLLELERLISGASQYLEGQPAVGVRDSGICVASRRIDAQCAPDKIFSAVARH